MLGFLIFCICSAFHACGRLYYRYPPLEDNVSLLKKTFSTSLDSIVILLGQIQLEICFSFNTCIYLTVGQNFLFLNVPLLPQQSEDISCCVEGSKDQNTKSWEPQHRDTLNNTGRLLPWKQTVRQEGHYDGYRQSDGKDVTKDRDSQKGRLPPQTAKQQYCYHGGSD